MGKESKIEWTEATWNPWSGCKKVSAGCKYCYMYRGKERYKKDPTEVIRSKSNFHLPLRWTDPRIIFTCSWSDWFIEEADAWRSEAWEVIRQTPEHTYQILTKRPERIKDQLPPDWGEGYPNVWLGVSVENKYEFARIQHLQKIAARVRFISFEPLLDHIDHHDLTGIHWAIIGGESGNETGKYKYRPCELEYIRSTIHICQKHNIPIFVKQTGTYLAKKLNLKDRHGRDITEWPEELQIRKTPEL